MMLKIGEFSRLSQVTVKTLHYYDEIGLLTPAQVDPFTDYRYYTLDQAREGVERSPDGVDRPPVRRSLVGFVAEERAEDQRGAVDEEPLRP